VQNLESGILKHLALLGEVEVGVRSREVVQSV